VGARIYPSPTEQAIEDGTILVHEGKISDVGPSNAVEVPRGATVADCRGLVVTAGFWNSHVHILTAELLHADNLSAGQLTLQLQQMLTRRGFTTVFDVASVLNNTALIRRRIESGEVQGPRILTVGEPFWTKGGTPIYAKGFLEANHINIPDVESSAQGTERVRQQIRDGADGVKIFTGSIQQDGVLIMPDDVVKGIVSEAHRAGKPVFAHPSNAAGIEVAIRSGVGILAHPATQEIPDAPAMASRLKTAGMALIPTLTLIDVEGKKSGEPAAEIEQWINMVAWIGPENRGNPTAGSEPGHVSYKVKLSRRGWASLKQSPGCPLAWPQQSIASGSSHVRNTNSRGRLCRRSSIRWAAAKKFSPHYSRVPIG